MRFERNADGSLTSTIFYVGPSPIPVPCQEHDWQVRTEAEVVIQVCPKCMYSRSIVPAGELADRLVEP